MKKATKLLFFILAYIYGLNSASAHEAYVLPKNYFWEELRKPPSIHAFDALKNPANFRITIIIVLAITILLGLNFAFRKSYIGSRFHQMLNRLSPLGPIFIRAAIATAFFYSALSWSFLGPELPIQSLPLAWIIRLLLFVISFLIAIGLFTEIAALASFIIFTIGFFSFGVYLITYLNYLGEIIVLMLFGMRKWSFDKMLFGQSYLFKKWKKYETTIVRVFYGLALAYAGIMVKFLHPELTIKVINDWHLTKFYWLFPGDPLLVTLGAGLAELAIGIFVIFGFEMRITIFISLIYITMSLLYFRELVWPHLMLYGISLNLLVEPETFTIDNIIFKKTIVLLLVIFAPIFLPVKTVFAQAASGTASFYVRNLSYGLTSDTDVMNMQKFLKGLGYFSGPANGNFGPLTLSAVKKFQSDNKIISTGYWGPLTIAAAKSSEVAAPPAAAYNYLRIFYFRDGRLARESLFAHPDSIDVLAPQSYSFDSFGNLSGSVKTDISSFAEKNNIKVMPLITNGNFNKNVYRSILDNQMKQDLAIKSLVNESKKKGYWGWQFDFEQMDASYKEKYSSFISKTAENFKSNNLTLSVAVIAQISSNPNDYPNDLWQKTIGVYDYAALAKSANFISVMSYDDPESTGPVVEYSWLKRVLDYSLKFIPSDKLSMGIPLYYWQWNNKTGARVGIGGRQGIYNVFARHKVSVNYDAEMEAAFLTYYNRARQYTIWYENAQSLAKKIELMAQYKLQGFSAWALGLELPSIYKIIKK